ncbi:MAG TPA: heparan-alpha-glucosaminide N-acetyltransferase domain-containing protein [Gemmatimonadales bacterium]|nr:heparan-alpha-glucosaminide N-acetyltransferase domain-containing protein [Gemmatimonadales bacterium]
MLAPAQRLRSLDAFRGLTVLGMLLVNNPGTWAEIYPPMRHAEWHGWTPTDLIFPYFLFIVGVALVFGLERQRSQGATHGAMLRRIAARTAVIILTGWLLAGFPRYNLETLRLPGVLPRIGVVYGIAAVGWVFLTPLAVGLLAILLLVLYWALMTLVPVPGFGPGVLEPIGNLAQYIDNSLLHGHLWKPEWDPEGLLSTLPAIATCLIGAQVGHWLRRQEPSGRTVRDMILAGAGGLAIGWAWGLVFPINKSLWTSSYAVFTAGAALLTLAPCYWLIEVRRNDRWALPAYVMGANALAAFVGSGLMARLLILIQVDGGKGPISLQRWIYLHSFASWAGPLNGSLAYAIAFTLFWVLLLWLPYRRGWRWRA